MQQVGHGCARLFSGGIAQEGAQVLRGESQASLAKAGRRSGRKTLFYGGICLMASHAVQFGQEDLSAALESLNGQCFRAE